MARDLAAVPSCGLWERIGPTIASRPTRLRRLFLKLVALTRADMQPRQGIPVHKLHN